MTHRTLRDYEDSPYHEALAAIATDGVRKHDLPADHNRMIEHGASCQTCWESYPGAIEHGLRFNAESGMYEAFDAAHPAAWIIADEL